MRTVTLRVKLRKEQKVDYHRTPLFSFSILWQLQLLTIVYLTFLFFSSSSAPRVSPIHTEPAKPSSSPLWRHQQLSRTGPPPASALWIFSGCVTAEVEGWWPLSAGGHAAFPPEGQEEQRSAWIFAFCNSFKGAIHWFYTLSSVNSSCGVLLNLWKQLVGV